MNLGTRWTNFQQKYPQVIRAEKTNSPNGVVYRIGLVRPTIIRGESTLLLAKRAKNWRETHADGSEFIVLKIVQTWYEESDEIKTQISLPRSILLSRIGRLAELAEQASKPGHYLLHLGI